MSSGGGPCDSPRVLDATPPLPVARGGVVHTSREMFTIVWITPVRRSRNCDSLRMMATQRWRPVIEAPRGGRRAHERRTAREAPTNADRGASRRRPRPNRAPAHVRQADREGTPGPAARSRIVRRARHVCDAPRDRVRPRQPARPWRRRGHRTWHCRRAPGLRLQPGLHGLRRVAFGGVRREDLQDHGSRDEGRRPGGRAQRFRRRTNPGGRRVPRRLCGDLPAQRACLGRRAADQRDHGTVRWWGRLFAGDD